MLLANSIPTPRLCLLVDDSAVIRRVAAGMFHDLGYIIAEADGGRKALEICEQWLPDVILLDWNMPEMDGITCLTNLRANLRGVPGTDQPKVILCTTENTLEKIAAAMAAGADEYIMKPFDKEILQGKLIQLGLEPASENAA